MTPPVLPRAFLPLAAAAVLAGCSLAPTYERPEVELPAGFASAAAPAASEDTAAARPGWRSLFGDPALRQLVELALQRNQDLRIAALNIERARAQWTAAGADRFPSLSASYAGSRSQPRTATNPQAVNASHTLGLGFSAFELDFFGRVASLSEAARAQFLATAEARRSAEISLVAEVASTYLAWRGAVESAALTQDTLKGREESFKLVGLKAERGAASELDRVQAQSLVEAARASLAQFRRQQQQSANALVQLTGSAALPSLPASLPLSDDGMVAPLPALLPSSLLDRRPDLRQAEQVLRAANANIGAARAAFLPRLSLTTSAGVASTALDQLLSDGTRAWSLGASAALPIFDFGRNQANLDAARTQAEIAVAQYRKAVQVALRETSDALAGLETYDVQMRAQQAQAEAERQRFDLTELRYRAGASSQLDQLDAQRSLLATQQAAVQSRVSLLQARVALYRALGGDWTEAIRDERDVPPLAATSPATPASGPR